MVRSSWACSTRTGSASSAPSWLRAPCRLRGEYDVAATMRFASMAARRSMPASTAARASGVGALTMASALRQRSEEHRSELQSLMRISYAVLCLKKKTITNNLYLTSLYRQQMSSYNQPQHVKLFNITDRLQQVRQQS